MLLLWIMVGLTFVALLVLNILLFRHYRSERKRRYAVLATNKESAFLRNCAVYNLSVREIEVLRLILTGYTYRSIANLLFISERTVDKHVRNIYEKVGVNNKIALICKLYDSEATL